MADGILLQDGTGSLLLQDSSELLLQLQVVATEEVIDFDVSIGTLLCSTMEMTKSFAVDVSMGVSSSKCADMSASLETDTSFSQGVNRVTDG